jgi:hypothetical protein
MPAFWITFAGRKPACVEADDKASAEDLAKRLTDGGDVRLVQTLPYPAEPRLNRVHHHQYGPSPSFCYRPETCAGRTSCPQRRSCTE